MKSLFKRTLASATGSVLVLSQLAATSVNISAAEDTGASLTVDKEFALFVPIDEADPLNALHSDWNDKAESKLAAVTNGKDAVTKTVATAKAKSKLKEQLVKYSEGYADEADIDALLAAISSTANAKVDADGSFTVTFTASEFGKALGELAEKNVNKHYDNFAKDDKGIAIDIDWSGYKASGQAVVEGKVDFGTKTVSYETSIIDETGKKYTNKAIKEYVAKKLDDAAKFVLADAATKTDNGITALTEKVASISKAVAENVQYAETIANEINTISLTADSVDAAYTAYLAAVKTKIEGAAIPEAKKKQALKLFNKAQNKAPDTATAAFTSEQFSTVYDFIVDAANKVGEDKGVDVTLSAQDITDLLTNDGYDYEVSIPNGYSADITFKTADDQQEELKAKVLEVYAAKWAAEKKELDTFESYKKVTLNVDTDYVVSGEVFYDVERVITYTLKDIEEETTTSSTTTTSTTDTQTTTSTTDTDDTTSSTTTSTTLSDDTTTSTTTSTTVSDGTTTSTTTSTTGTDDGTTTSSTTTTPITYVAFDLKGLEQNSLIYWSEEETQIDLSKLEVTLDIVEAGEVVKSIDVSDAFAPAANSTSEIDAALPQGVGYNVINVPYVLVDADAVAAKLTAEGYTAAEMVDIEGNALANYDKETKTGTKAGYFKVTVVLRGDATLDGQVDIADAISVLCYYNMRSVAEWSVADILEDRLFLAGLDGDLNYLPLAHYAADVTGEGFLNVADSIGILSYYNLVIGDMPSEWDSTDVLQTEEGVKTVVLPILHKDPMHEENSYFGEN